MTDSAQINNEEIIDQIINNKGRVIIPGTNGKQIDIFKNKFLENFSEKAPFSDIKQAFNNIPFLDKELNELISIEHGYQSDVLYTLLAFEAFLTGKNTRIYQIEQNNLNNIQNIDGQDTEISGDYDKIYREEIKKRVLEFGDKEGYILIPLRTKTMVKINKDENGNALTSKEGSVVLSGGGLGHWLSWAIKVTKGKISEVKYHDSRYSLEQDEDRQLVKTWAEKNLFNHKEFENLIEKNVTFSDITLQEQGKNKACGAWTIQAFMTYLSGKKFDDISVPKTLKDHNIWEKFKYFLNNLLSFLYKFINSETDINNNKNLEEIKESFLQERSERLEQHHFNLIKFFIKLKEIMPGYSKKIKDFKNNIILNNITDEIKNDKLFQAVYERVREKINLNNNKLEPRGRYSGIGAIANFNGKHLVIENIGVNQHLQKGDVLKGFKYLDNKINLTGSHEDQVKMVRGNLENLGPLTLIIERNGSEIEIQANRKIHKASDIVKISNETRTVGMGNETLQTNITNPITTENQTSAGADNLSDPETTGYHSGSESPKTSPSEARKTLSEINSSDTDAEITSNSTESQHPPLFQNQVVASEVSPLDAEDKTVKQEIESNLSKSQNSPLFQNQVAASGITSGAESDPDSLEALTADIQGSSNLDALAPKSSETSTLSETPLSPKSEDTFTGRLTTRRNSIPYYGR